MQKLYVIKPSGPIYRKNMKKIAIFSHGKIYFTDYVSFMCQVSWKNLEKKGIANT